MKNMVPKNKSTFSSNKAVVNDAPAKPLSRKERNRRIDLAAKHTVKRYGHIIERLAKE